MKSRGPHDSRREHAFAAAALAVLVVMSFPGVVFLGRTLQAHTLAAGVSGPAGLWHANPNRPLHDPFLDAVASASTYEPSTLVIHDALRRGEIPLWNAHSALGEPFAANFLTGLFTPLRWPVFLFPAQWIQDAYLLARLFLAAFLAYLYLREIRVGWLGAMTGGAIFGLSGYFVLLVNMVHLDVEIWLPLVLLTIERLCRNPSARGIAWIALATALPVLGGNPESVAIALCVAVLYLFFRSRLLLPVLWRGSLGLLLGILLAAPLLVPGLEYMTHSVHAKPTTTGLEFVPWRTIVLAIVPDFFGVVNDTWGGINPMTRWFALGIVPWTLGLAGLAARRADGAQWFFGGILAASVMKLYGFWPVQWIGCVPLLQLVLFTKHLQPVIALCVGVLAAFAVDRLSKENAGRRAILVAAVFLGVVVCAFAWRFQKAAIGAHAWPPTLHAVLVELGVLLVLIGAASAFRSRVRAALVGLAAVACLWFHVPSDRPERRDPLPEPAFVSALRADASCPRFVGFDAVMPPNWAGVFGLDDLRFLNGFSVASSTQWIRARIEPMTVDRFVGTDSPAPDFFGTAIDQAGIRFLVALRPIEEHVTRFMATRAWRRFPGDGGFDLKGSSSQGALALLVSPNRPHELEIPLPPRAAKLSADVATSSGVARVRVEVERLRAPRSLYRRFLDPVGRAQDRRRFEGTASIPDGAGYLLLRVDPGPNGDRRFDRVCWMGLRTEPGGPLAPNGLADFQIAAPEINSAESVTESVLEDSRLAIVQRAPSVLRTPVRAVPGGSRVSFAVAFHPELLDHLQCDGAECEIAWQERGDVTTLCAETIGPDGRHVDLDLSRFSGETILLRLISDDAATSWSRVAPELFGRTLQQTFERDDVYVYRNPDALPRAYFVAEEGVVMVESREEAVARTADPAFDARRQVVIERESNEAVEAPSHVSPSSIVGSVRLTSHENARVSLDISAETNGRCVLLDAPYPGWSATLDGVEVPIRRANGAFRAVAVPRGDHRLRFDYRPASYRVGMTLFALAAFAVGSMLWKRPRLKASV